MQNKQLNNERLLLASIAKGDERAFRQLFDFYRNHVFTYSMRYLKDRDLAQEVVQEVFLKVWYRRINLNEVLNFGAFLRVLTRNLTLDFLKKIASDYNKAQAALQFWEESDNSTENSILLKDSTAYVDRFIQNLPPQQQLIFKMCRIDGLKYKEVAEKLGISSLTVKSHLQEATKNLKSYLNGCNSVNLLVIVFVGWLK